MANKSALIVINLNNSAEEEELLLEEPKMEFDSDLEGFQAKIKEIDEESNKINQLQSEVNKQMEFPGRMPTLADKMESDKRSIYVGNVDYGTTEVELKSYFQECGSINRVNIMCNKFTGHPKGYAYIEFSSEESVDAALLLHEGLFRGRLLKVMSKRTNQPGLSKTNKFPRSMKGNVFKSGPRKPNSCSCKCGKKFGNFKFAAKHYHSGNF